MKKLTSRQTLREIAELGIETTMAKGFGFLVQSVNQRYDTHRHTKHQLLRSHQGMLAIETKTHFHTCAAPMAIWIPAGVRHATVMGAGGVSSLFFSATHYPWPSKEVHQMKLTPLLTSMIDTAAEGVEGTRVFQRQFFDVLAELCRRTLTQPDTPALAIPVTPEMQRAVEHLFARLGDLTIPSLAQAAGMSERTLRRRFRSELKTSPEAYLRQARLIKAMQLLRDPRSRSISEIALEVGYANQSAFTAAFRRFTQQTPAGFRQAD